MPQIVIRRYVDKRSRERLVIRANMYDNQQRTDYFRTRIARTVARVIGISAVRISSGCARVWRYDKSICNGIAFEK